jgi:hypothetical protein
MRSLSLSTISARASISPTVKWICLSSFGMELERTKTYKRRDLENEGKWKINKKRKSWLVFLSHSYLFCPVGTFPAGFWFSVVIIWVWPLPVHAGYCPAGSFPAGFSQLTSAITCDIFAEALVMKEFATRSTIARAATMAIFAALVFPYSPLLLLYGKLSNSFTWPEGGRSC